MATRAGGLVARAARALALPALAVLAACGQKGPLIGIKPAPPPVVSDIAPDASLAVPAAAPTSAPPPR